MIRRPPRSTRKESSAASDVYKRQGSCTLAKQNWKVCNTDQQFTSALDSWQEKAKYDVEISRLRLFLDQLFRYGKGPIIWTDHPSREQAPLYLVSHHKGIQSHLCYQQWGCRDCGAATNQLYHASWTLEECVEARKEMCTFLLSDAQIIACIPSTRPK